MIQNCFCITWIAFKWANCNFLSVLLRISSLKMLIAFFWMHSLEMSSRSLGARNHTPTSFHVCMRWHIFMLDMRLMIMISQKNCEDDKKLSVYDISRCTRKYTQHCEMEKFQKLSRRQTVGSIALDTIFVAPFLCLKSCKHHTSL